MKSPIELRSDNAVGFPPEMLAAVSDANHDSALAYGGDQWTKMLTEKVREVFDHPEARIFPVSTGTAANALALSAMSPPWGAILCHEKAHIITSEGGATSMYGAGAVMTGLAGADFKLATDVVRATLEAVAWGDPHVSQPAVLSMTQPSEHGTVYSVSAVAELAAVAAEFGLTAHIDGARLANAVARLGCSPADVTWRAGVTALTLGATKNGAMSTDAIVSFDPSLSDELVYRTKRAGHVASKMRFQSAQLIAYLTDGLWLRLAGAANRAMERLAFGLRDLKVTFLNQPEVNILFLRLEEAVIKRLEDDGLMFYRISPDTIRLVTSFQTTDDEVDEVLSRFGDALASVA